MPSDEPTTSALLARSHRRFLAFLRARVPDEATAEDILQGAYVKSVEKAADVRDEESVVAWFYRLLKNALIDHHRRTTSERRALAAFEREIDEELAPELERNVCACVKEVLPTLKPEYASVVAAADLGGRRLDQIAEDVGITPGNAAVRLHRARAALRQRLTAVCGLCATHGCVDCSCKAAPR